MLYYVTLTQVCGLKCKYCQNTPDEHIQPIRLSYDIDALVRFISSDPDPVICFYGGDPLMEVGLIERIINLLPNARFVIQTNGLRFRLLKPEIILRFDTILVSIDGRPEVTDFYRGEGIYNKVLDNVRYVRELGFKGDLVARMAVSGKTDIYLDVMHLLDLGDLYFDHVHWQLDALWDYPPAQRYRDFKEWLYETYFPGLNKLVVWWIDELSGGRVPGIAPFKGIVYRLLTGFRAGIIPCGSGIDAFAVGTDGRLLACPIAPEYNFNYVGDIWTCSPESIYGSVRVGGPCLNCDYFDVCGGRCLFANKTMLWGEDGFHLVCESVKYLINLLKRQIPKIRALLEDNVINIDMLKYPPFLNSIEVIP